MTRAVLIIAALLMAAAGCTETFDPNTGGPRPIAVFAVLNTASDSQIVRLTATSDPTDPNPSIRPVAGAVVTVDGPEGLITYEPVQRAGEPGTPDSIYTEFIARSFRPTRGGTYTLRVNAPSGDAISMIVVPTYYASPIYLRDFFILQNPHSYSLTTLVTANATIAAQTLGLMVRFMVEYEVLRDGVWVVERVEVPTVYVIGPNVTEPVYPRLHRRENVVPSSGGAPHPETAFFSNRVYEETISLLHYRFGSDNLRLRQVIFYLVQADEHFFMYYSFANGFDDPLSIRVDQPDYSNITGGLGIFGSLTLDSVAYPIPANLGPRNP